MANFKRKNNKRLSKKKLRVEHLASWSRQAHKRDKIFEAKKYEDRRYI